MQSEAEFVSSVSNGLAKAVLYICLTVFGCMWLSNCTLSENTIVICQESCNSNKTYMESVTSQECICSSNKSKDIWMSQ